MASYAVIVSVWGDYWERFGEGFIKNVQGLSPQPDEVIVASSVPIDLPAGFTNVISDVMMWDSFNDAVNASSAEWVWPVGVDDRFCEGAFDGLPVDCDVISLTGVRSDNGGLFQADSDAYSWMLNNPNNPMSGSVMMKRHVWDSCPWRRVVWPDWVQWLEIKKLGFNVKFDRVDRFTFVRHDGAHSARPSSLGQQQCDEMRKILREYNVVPGVEFPPQILK